MHSTMGRCRGPMMSGAYTATGNSHYRKITNGQFCSDKHRKAYWSEQERLAVERLHQTHDCLQAYRPPGALEAILGIPTEQDPPAFWQALPEPISPRTQKFPEFVATDPLTFDVYLQAIRPSLPEVGFDTDR